MLPAALTGFATGISLILVIGAQNAFVLRQGLAREYVLPVCLICAGSDAALISAGVIGAGSLGARLPSLVDLLSWGGAIFLIAYGFVAARRALDPGRLLAADRRAGSLKAAVGTALALTWLNPHVYLDTVALIGAISTRFEPAAAKVAFGAGAVLASFVFFFTLGYGARLLAPFFAKPRAWAVLDGLIAIIMWAIAASLIRSTL